MRVSLLPTASAFFLMVMEKECFVIEQPVDTQMTIKYEIPSQAEDTAVQTHAAGKAVKLTLTDRKKEAVVYSSTLTDHSGEIEVTAADELCFIAQGVRIDLDIEVGLSDRYYDQLADQHNMDKLQIQVVKLNDQLAGILAEADFMKEKEVKFHSKSERVNLATLWFPMLQLAILIITALFYVRNLKTFFATKQFY